MFVQQPKNVDKTFFYTLNVAKFKSNRQKVKLRFLAEIRLQMLFCATIFLTAKTVLYTYTVTLLQKSIVHINIIESQS